MENRQHYEKIEKAIQYLKANFKTQPSLDEVAAAVDLSPFYFQRIFTDWAGVSPKKFLQYLSIDYAKHLLKEDQATLFDTAFETGFTGTSRLHDLFINIEGMTPGEYKHGGRQLNIRYSFAETLFGRAIIASTDKGICYLAFTDDPRQGFEQLRQQFPEAHYEQVTDLQQQNALSIFSRDWRALEKIKLHLKATPFQLKVWNALLHIPAGRLTTYGSIASSIEHGKANRAVGSAVGENPVAFLIPCHRVIRSTGELGAYHWGADRKTAMIGWEMAQAK